MATDQPQSTISLKLLIDEEKNRVVVAEADKDFVDVLFSFLTLPMGTIIRLLSTRTEPPMIGSLNSLYKGVADLDAQYFQTETCKSMLLSPRNSSEAPCKNLKMNIDDTEPTKYYFCACRALWNQPLLSTFKNTRCHCGKVMNKEIGFEDSEVASKVNDDEGVFVNGMAKFMITDDLKVSLGIDSSFALLNSIGIRAVQVMEINLGTQEVLNLLAGALFSKTPLTDVFLRKLAFPSNFSKGEFEPKGSLGAPNESQPTTNTDKMEVKLHSMKSSKKILFAEAGEDFVDFLFSFLTFPLGSMVKLSGSNSSLGCIDNLYRSVGSSDFVKYMKSQDCKARLLSPKIADQFYVQNGLLDVEEFRRDYRFSTRRHANTDRKYPILSTISGCYLTDLMNPKTSTWKTQRGGGFVRRLSTFMVTDDLVVIPASVISTIALLRGMGVPASELENRVISVGKDEALNLLKASLISNSALTNAFNMEKPQIKQEN